LPIWLKESLFPRHSRITKHWNSISLVSNSEGSFLTNFVHHNDKFSIFINFSHHPRHAFERYITASSTFFCF
jgi:hypothetical protein